MKRLITSFALTMLVMLGASGIASAQTETLTLAPRTNAVETGQIIKVPAAPGWVYSIVVHDAGLSGGQLALSYTSQSGDTTSSVASAVVSAINGNSTLATLGVTATLGTGPNYTIQSTSTKATTYTESVTSGSQTCGCNFIAIQETLTLSGTVHTGDVLTVTVHDAGLTGGQESVSVTAQAGNQLSNLVAALRTAINSDTKLKTLGISANISPTNSSLLLIQSNTYDKSGHITSYNTAASSGATETLALGDFFGTNGVQKITVGGTVTPGDVVAFAITDSALSGGIEQVSYTVQSSDSLATLASSLAAVVNADTNLANLGVSATAASGVLALNSNSEELVGVIVVYTGTRCVNVDGSSTPLANSVWPGGAYTKRCGSASTADANTMLSTLAGFANFPGPINGLANPIADAYGRISVITHLAHPRDIISITIHDPLGLQAYEPQGITLPYTVPSPATGASLTTVAQNLVSQINNLPQLQNDGISASITNSNGATIVFQVTGPQLATASGVGGTDPTTLIVNEPLQFAPGQPGQTVFTLSGGDPNDQIITYIFNDYTEVNNSALVSADTPGGCVMPTIPNPEDPSDSRKGAFGYVWTNPTTHVPCFVVLNDANINSTPLRGPELTSVANTVSHEWGHVLDYVYAHDGVLTDNNTGQYAATNTLLWLHNAMTSLQYVNDWYPCAVLVTSGPSSPFETPGLLTNIQDLAGNYFCAAGTLGGPPPSEPGLGAALNSSPDYFSAALNGVLNGAGPNGVLGVLALSQPNIYGKYQTAADPNPGNFNPLKIGAEMFAEMFAYQSGNSKPHDYPSIACSTIIAETLFLNGTVYAGGYGFGYYPSATITGAQFSSPPFLNCPAN